MIISDSGIYSQTNQSVLKIQRLNKQRHVAGMYSSEFICEKAASNGKPLIDYPQIVQFLKETQKKTTLSKISQAIGYCLKKIINSLVKFYCPKIHVCAKLTMIWQDYVREKIFFPEKNFDKVEFQSLVLKL